MQTNNQLNNTSTLGNQTIQEDPKMVAQKGNKATKILADNIGDMYRKKLLTEGRIQDQSATTLQAQNDKSLKHLSELVAEKFRFSQINQPVVNNTDAERLRREQEELARQKAQLQADRATFNKEVGRYQDERIGDALLGMANPQQGVVRTNVRDRNFDVVIEKPVLGKS